MNRSFPCGLALLLLLGFGAQLSCDESDDDDNDDDNDDGADDDAGYGDDDDDGAAGEVWVDTTTGLMWQNGEAVGLEEFTLQQALDHCDTLTWGQYSDWRLPTIAELRSLIRGCSNTVTGGQCGVTDSCLNHDNCWNDLCNGCDDYDGPGADGLYWPDQLTGQCCFYWSASLREPDQAAAWNVHFDGGLVGTDGVGFHLSVRCVRN